jgi:hypothetical protein
MTVQKFIKLREKIEDLNRQTEKWIAEKSIYESSKIIEASQKLLIDLKRIADNEIQKKSTLRLENEIEWLGNKVDEILSNREAGKIGDGNIALKCNWNDRNYRAPCSDEAYEFNLKQGRAWCGLSESNCRSYNEDVNLDNHPCYESIAFKELFFGAGWDHTEERQQPRHIHNVRVDRVALLTTRPPGADEKNRIIIGCLYINEVLDDPGEETKIFGDVNKSIIVDYDDVKVNFWDYYKNPGAEDVILWASGLFRYVSNETVEGVLRGIGEKYTNAGKDTVKIIELIKHYEQL